MMIIVCVTAPLFLACFFHRHFVMKSISGACMVLVVWRV